MWPLGLRRRLLDLYVVLGPRAACVLRLRLRACSLAFAFARAASVTAFARAIASSRAISASFAAADPPAS